MTEPLTDKQIERLDDVAWTMLSDWRAAGPATPHPDDYVNALAPVVADLLAEARRNERAKVAEGIAQKIVAERGEALYSNFPTAWYSAMDRATRIARAEAVSGG